MDFLAFLQAAQSPEFWQQRRNFCFTGSTYPLAWFSMFFKVLETKQLLPAPFQRIFIENTEKKTLYATLNQSILGTYSFFLLGDVTDEKETKSSLEFVSFVLTYKGPNYITYFVNNTSKVSLPRGMDAVVIPQELSAEQCKAVIAFFESTLDAKKTAWFKKTLTTSTVLSLDTCCMLIQYLELIGPKYFDEYTHFLETLIGASPSLSLLSEYFFAKNAVAFFSVWSKIGKEYPDVFWITFWSEQLWKAHHVIHFLKQKDFVVAKRTSFRLPYSFINRDWQKSNPIELVNAYAFLYRMDYGLKTGSTFCGLDLLYMNYFSGTFAAQGTQAP